MRNSIAKVEGLLLNDALRKAGRGIIKGEERIWDEAYQITVLPVGDRKGNARKYSVLPAFASDISEQLSSVSWGSVISLEFTDGLVSSVAVLSDFGDSYATD